MVARQAMQDQEIPDFIEHKQIVAVFDLPENAKTMVKENMGIALLHDTCYQDPDLKFIPLENMPSSLLQKNFIEILKSEY